MINIGIDSVKIERFNLWQFYSPKKLSRIFSQEEIAYCLDDKARSAERFAARFAAKEAFYKALSSSLDKTIPFLTLCRALSLSRKPSGAPHYLVNWQLLEVSDLSVSISLTHTNQTATAIVLLQKQ